MFIGAFSILSICTDGRIGQKVYPFYPFSEKEKLPIKQRTHLSSLSLSGKVWETVHAIKKQKGAQSNTLAGPSTISVSRKVPNEYANRQRDGQTYTQTDRQTNKQTDRQAYKQKDRLTNNRQTDNQTDKQKDGQTNTHTHTHTRIQSDRQTTRIDK